MSNDSSLETLHQFIMDIYKFQTRNPDIEIPGKVTRHHALNAIGDLRELLIDMEDAEAIEP